MWRCCLCFYFNDWFFERYCLHSSHSNHLVIESFLTINSDFLISFLDLKSIHISLLIHFHLLIQIFVFYQLFIKYGIINRLSLLIIQYSLYNPTYSLRQHFTLINIGEKTFIKLWFDIFVLYTVRLYFLSFQLLPHFCSWWQDLVLFWLLYYQCHFSLY